MTVPHQIWGEYSQTVVNIYVLIFHSLSSCGIVSRQFWIMSKKLPKIDVFAPCKNRTEESLLKTKTCVSENHLCNIYPNNYLNLDWHVSENQVNKAKTANWHHCKIFVFWPLKKTEEVLPKVSAFNTRLLSDSCHWETVFRQSSVFRLRLLSPIIHSLVPSFPGLICTPDSLP